VKWGEVLERVIEEVTLYVRYAETDAMGIVHHASYIVYFEEGRSNYARQRGGDYASLERSGYYLAVSEVHARYVKPARYGDQITIRCWLEEMKSRTITFAYQIIISDSGETAVTGYSKHICITRDGKVTTIPDEWRRWSST